MVSEVVQIYVTFEQDCRVSPHNITMVLAVVSTLKGHMEATWYITAVLCRDNIGQRTDMQSVAGWCDEDCLILYRHLSKLRTAVRTVVTLGPHRSMRPII